MTLTKSDLQEIKKVVKDEVGGVKEEVRKSERRILKKLEIVSYTLDKQTMEVAKRVTKIEEHLRIPTN